MRPASKSALLPVPVIGAGLGRDLVNQLHVGEVLGRRRRRRVEILGRQIGGHDVAVVVVDVWQPVPVCVVGERVAELEAPDLIRGQRHRRLDELVAGLRELGDSGRLEQIDVVEDAERGAERADAVGLAVEVGHVPGERAQSRPFLPHSPRYRPWR